MGRMCLTSTWAFTISIWLGAIPFTKKGTIARAQSIYFVVMMVGPSVLSLLCRMITNYYSGTQIAPDPLLGVKELIASFNQLSLSASCCLHISQCFSERRKFKVFFTSLEIHSDTKIPVKTILVMTLHAGLFALAILSSLSLLRRSLTFALNLVSLHSSLIALQFETTLQLLTRKLRSLTLLLVRKKIYGYEFYRTLKLAENLNTAYQRQIFFTLASAFGYCVVYLYFVIDGVLNLDYLKTGKISLTYYLLVIVIRVLTVFMITWSPHKFHEAAEEFNDNLFKLMREHKKLCNDNKLALYVTMSQTVNFSACGFFNLGNRLITSIIAAATTYLVILVQFSIHK